MFSFNPGANNYLRALKRGSLVYAETHFELRQPDVNASPDTNEGQRQIFLRHGACDVISFISCARLKLHPIRQSPSSCYAALNTSRNTFLRRSPSREWQLYLLRRSPYILLIRVRYLPLLISILGVRFVRVVVVQVVVVVV